jgi:deoxyribodipyrimidine photolyase-related protein
VKNVGELKIVRMQKAKIVFPHQLFKNSPLFDHEGPFYLVEEYLFFNQYQFHKQKIAFHRATMKYYENFLQQKGCEVIYIESTSKFSDIRTLIKELHSKNIKDIRIIDPIDDYLNRRIIKSCDVCKITLQVLDTPMFLNTTKDLKHFFKPEKKKFFQTEFYKQERISRNILMTSIGEPLGGKWTFDTENRKKYPKGKAIVAIEYPKTNMYHKEALTYTNLHFMNNFGALDGPLNYPVTHESSELWLDQFLQKRMEEFGEYEDAIVYKEALLNHSLLTPMLNVGLLIPAQIIAKTIDDSLKNDIPINSLEGFTRQIVGWREFIRGIYITKGREERTKNFWGFKRKIPPSFYDGSTGILPIDKTIKKILKTGYCHHIERLMVLGNFMLLCEFDPDEVYRWFMEMFIDAYDWVMVPNVYGMSQFADGGLMSTKPYISGSNYLMKMSDYPKGDWEEVWDALFWSFMDNHRAFFLKNPRLGMLVRTFDKWDEGKKQRVHEKSNKFILGLERGK